MLALVRQTLQRYQMVEPGDLVVVACSGGPDSTALLHLLWRLREELGISLHVAHLDHGFRGRQSREDLRVVADLAISLGLPATLGTADVAGLARRRRWSKQLAAREARYTFLQRVAMRAGAKTIAFGHNRDDQAETVVMRLLRGTGLNGLSGIPLVRTIPGLPGGLVIRPLLFSARSEIEEYCREEGLSPRQDPSNLQPVYLRNRLRLELMPELRRYNPRLDQALAWLAEQARDDVAWLELEGRDLLGRMRSRDAQGGLLLDPLRQAPVSLQRRALRQALTELWGQRNPFAGGSYQQVESLRQLVLAAAPAGHLDLALGVTADRRYDRLYLALTAPDVAGASDIRAVRRRGAAPRPDLAPLPLSVPGRTELPALGLAIEAEVLPGPLAPAQMKAGEAYLDLARLSRQLLVRTRRPGDRFRPLGAPGTKRLKDFLMEQRVPREDRDRIPLVCAADGHLVWVGGLRPAEDARVSEATRLVLHLRIV
ncbi:MAG: tRNA lysidine(34) synthetase TilS [Symbiobacteriia bacterium]